MSPQTKQTSQRGIELLVHVVVWLYLIISPFVYHRRNEAMTFTQLIQGGIFPLLSCFFFYLNYLYLVPRLFLRSRYKPFLLYNFSCILLLSAVNSFIILALPRPPIPEIELHHGFGHEIIMKARDIFNYLFVAALAVVIRLSMQWQRAETARKEADLGRTEAEIRNLKSQMNPHFLLNTLNNIYALTAFDTERAQEAIQELSRLLRYILYENEATSVSLKKEIDFLQNYIALMRIRLAPHIKVEVDFQIPENDTIQVAPLIFISLIENAFKHGVSPTRPCFIKIQLKADDNVIHFLCVNSNFPKDEQDKSPGGIGLQQVTQRLDLSYPGRYIYERGPSEDGQIYSAEIIIHAEKKYR